MRLNQYIQKILGYETSSEKVLLYTPYEIAGTSDFFDFDTKKCMKVSHESDADLFFKRQRRGRVYNQSYDILQKQS